MPPAPPDDVAVYLLTTCVPNTYCKYMASPNSFLSSLAIVAMTYVNPMIIAKISSFWETAPGQQMCHLLSCPSEAVNVLDAKDQEASCPNPCQRSAHQECHVWRDRVGDWRQCEQTVSTHIHIPVNATCVPVFGEDPHPLLGNRSSEGRC